MTADFAAMIEHAKRMAELPPAPRQIIVSRDRFLKWKSTNCDGALLGLHDDSDTCIYCESTE